MPTPRHPHQQADHRKQERQVAWKQKCLGVVAHRCGEPLCDPLVQVRRRGKKTRQRRTPSRQCADQTRVGAGLQVRHKHQHDRDQCQQTDYSRITQSLQRAQRFTQDRAVQKQPAHTHGQEHRAVAARERLQAEHPQRQAQMAGLSLVEVLMHPCQTEGHPMHGGELQLANAEEPGGRKRKDEPCDEGGRDAGAHAAGQQVGPEATERN